MTLPILYHCADARSLRCLWAALETGIDIDLRVLPFPPRAFATDYRPVNPLMTLAVSYPAAVVLAKPLKAGIAGFPQEPKRSASSRRMPYRFIIFPNLPILNRCAKELL